MLVTVVDMIFLFIYQILIWILIEPQDIGSVKNESYNLIIIIFMIV